MYDEICAFVKKTEAKPKGKATKKSQLRSQVDASLLVFVVCFSMTYTGKVTTKDGKFNL